MWHGVDAAQRERKKVINVEGGECESVGGGGEMKVQ